MKRTLITAFLVPAAMAAVAMAQNATGPDAPMGRSRGGDPYAWNDKDKDGICDITGQPVGQGRGGATAGQRMGRGRGAAAGPGMGRGRGFGGGFGARQQPEGPQY